jgi:hypothetical protein
MKQFVMISKTSNLSNLRGKWLLFIVSGADTFPQDLLRFEAQNLKAAEPLQRRY